VIGLHDEEDGGGEPVRGLPQALPEGEQILWQGQPSVLAFAVHVFHVRLVAAYFLIATSWRLARLSSEGAGGAAMTEVVTFSAMAAAGAFALLFLLAWSMARASVYTITSKRVVLRWGVAIRKYVNLPFTQLAAADFRTYGRGKGDVALSLTEAKGLGYLKLWPHVRPFRYMRPQPSLRGLSDVAQVAGTLRSAIAAEAPGQITLPAAPRPAMNPARGNTATAGA
jgi:hypothetical protein